MKLTIDVDDNQLVDCAEQLLKEYDEECGSPLSIVFGNDEPEIFFLPHWSSSKRDYEARLPLKQALKDELESMEGSEGEEDKVEMLKRLIAVLEGE